MADLRLRPLVEDLQLHRLAEGVPVVRALDGDPVPPRSQVPGRDARGPAEQPLTVGAPGHTQARGVRDLAPVVGQPERRVPFSASPEPGKRSSL